MSINSKPNSILQTIKSSGLVLLLFVVIFWALEIGDFLVPGSMLDQSGVVPRTARGLRGIFLMPFLHGGFAHLISNTVPFLVLGALVTVEGMKRFAWVTFISVLISGLGVWVLGASNSVHIGASGLIFGYLGYLITNGWFERSVRAVLTAVIVGVVYGGLIWGVLPGQEGISWLGHLFGFIGGIVGAWLVADRY